MRKLRKRKKHAPVLQDIPVVRYQTDREHGLSEEQINERLEHRLVNDTKIKTSNSYLKPCSLINTAVLIFIISLLSYVVITIRLLTLASPQTPPPHPRRHAA